MTKSPSRSWAPVSALIASLVLASTAAAQSTVTVQAFSITGGTPSASDNDFTRIDDAVQAAGNGDTLILEGDFDWSQSDAMSSYTASQSTESYGYTWNETPITALIAPDGVSNVTIEAHASGASVTGFAKTDTRAGNTHGGTRAYPQPDLGFIYFGEGNTDGWTVDGVVLREFERTIVFADSGTPGSAHNTTIQNCTIDISNWQVNMGVGIALRGSNSNNLLVDGNTFEMIVNSGSAAQSGYGYVTNAIRADSGGNEALRDAQIINNTFDAVLDSSAIIPDKAANWCIAIDENSGSNQGSLTISNNTFDGRIPDGNGGFVSGAFQALRLDKAYNPPTSDPVYDGNTFIEFLRCFEARFNPGGGVETLVFTNTTFQDCGWSGPGYAPGFAEGLRQNVTSTGSAAPDTLAYQPSIANASGTIYAAGGGYDVETDLNLDWNGTTGIPALNAIALDPTGFEMIPDGLGGYAQAGILTADIVSSDAPAVIYERTIAQTDNAWQFTDRWTRPTPPVDDNGTDLSGTELAFGYNAIADPVPTGDTTKVQGMNTYTLTADESFAIGTIVDTDLTILSDQSKAGPDGSTTLYSIYPVSKQLAGAIFLVQPGASITFQDVIISGDNPSISGTIEARNAVELSDATSAVSIDNAILNNFLGGAIRTASGSSVSISNSLVENCGFAVNQPSNNAPATLTVSDSILSNFGTAAFVLESPAATASFTGNVFNEFSVFNIRKVPDDFTVTQNLFAQGGRNAEFAIGNNYGVPTTLNYTNNWSSNIYGEASEVTDGVITGDANVAGVAPFNQNADVINGDRLLDFGQNETIVESAIVATFDADLDAWPDAWELASNNFDAFDSDGDGWPDGVEAAQGTDPRDGGDFPAGVFNINADADNNGIVDWYEDSLQTNTAIDAFVGDVLRDGGAALTDAVRALHIVNGQFPNSVQESGDYNALDVTGLGSATLANPLQILRFQAGVRQHLPALPGIN